MGMQQYLDNNVKVTRPTKNLETTTTTVQEEHPYADLGLPFYYYFSPKISILLIAIGIILLILNICTAFGGFFIIWKRKNYKCAKCGRIYSNRMKNPKICTLCGGEVVPEETVNKG